MRLASLLAVPLLLAACSAAEPDPASSPTEAGAGAGAGVAEAEKPQLLLFTSLPIYWSEGGLGDILSDKAQVHWARTALERRYALKPVDALTALPTDGGTLLMAQPRALSPAENVALDDFVRAGGRVVLIADPMLDAHSAYGLGDKRRPAAIAMLSPILARWGLELVADGRAAHVVRWKSHDIPVEEGGVFELADKGHESACALEDGGLVAICRVGDGGVLLLGDATFLADGDDAGQGGDGLLLDLVETARAGAHAG